MTLLLRRSTSTLSLNDGESFQGTGYTPEEVASPAKSGLFKEGYIYDKNSCEHDDGRDHPQSQFF
jgi:hypothetical protein